MALTPVEIRHMTPGRGLFGYKAHATDQLLAEITASFEDVWRERADLADRVEQLEADLVRFRELEALLRTTLVSAERASADMKEQARREAELILSEARAEARALQRQALAENERLAGESRRLRAQLTAALASVDVEDAAPAVPVAEAAAAEPEATGADEQLEDDRQDTWHDFGGLPLPDANAA
jgi:cell division initiation protein